MDVSRQTSIAHMDVKYLIEDIAVNRHKIQYTIKPCGRFNTNLNAVVPDSTSKNKFTGKVRKIPK